jgi:hypothetical protein
VRQGGGGEFRGVCGWGRLSTGGSRRDTEGVVGGAEHVTKREYGLFVHHRGALWAAW